MVEKVQYPEHMGKPKDSNKHPVTKNSGGDNGDGGASAFNAMLAKEQANKDGGTMHPEGQNAKKKPGFNRQDWMNSR